ncbi:MAG: response regulator transcription factor [Psychromonas sp.]|nr:response regulator transcription factor [Alteromonadales bacterium]MCP5080043.1 response regulator transcription factor [Psychromonas sp.]
MRLLIIEDDLALAQGLKQNLTQQGYRVDHFDKVGLALTTIPH